MLDTHALRVHAETESLKHSFYTAFDFYGVSPSHVAGLYVVHMYNFIASSAARAKEIFVDSAQRRQNVQFLCPHLNAHVVAESRQGTWGNPGPAPQTKL